MELLKKIGQFIISFVAMIFLLLLVGYLWHKLYTYYHTDIGTLSDFILAIVALIALLVGGESIIKWGKTQDVKKNDIKNQASERLEDKKHELAQEVLALFYSMQETISWIRFPGAFEYELDKIEKESSEKDEIKKKGHYLVPKLRIRDRSDFLAKFSSMKNTARVKLHPSFKSYFEEMNKIINEISTSSTMLFTYVGNWDYKELKSLESVIWDRSSSDKKDDITIRIEKIIFGVEQLTETIIK